MSTATKPAPQDPKIYVKVFVAHATANNIPIETDSLMAWDAEHNHGAMRSAILAKYGTKALVEIAIKQMFQRYLYNSLAMRIVPSTSNPDGLKKGVPYVGGIRKGIYIPQMTLDTQEIALADAKARFISAGKQLKVLGLSLEILHKILEEI